MAAGIREWSAAISRRLIGVVGQQLADEADQSSRGLVSGTGDGADVGQQFDPRQRATGTVQFLDLGIEQVGHEIVRGMFGTPFHVLRERGDGIGEDVRIELAGGAVGQRDGGVRLGSDRLLVLLGNAEQVADDLHRHLGADVRDEIETWGARQGIEFAGTEFAGVRLDCRHPSRGEHA